MGKSRRHLCSDMALPARLFAHRTHNFARFSTSCQLKKPLRVDFYFDTVSPYSWPAFEVLCRYKTRWELDIRWKPVFLAGLTKGAGNKHLDNMANCPAKAAYGFMDLDTRTAKYFNIPLRMKEDPSRLIGVIGSIQAQRFVTGALQLYPDHTGDRGGCGQGGIWRPYNVLHRGGAGGGDVLGIG